MAETIKHRRERIQKTTLYQMGYKYLCDNFHKFSNDQKIKIALEAYKLNEAKPLVDNSTHHHITMIVPPERKEDFENRAQAVSV